MAGCTGCNDGPCANPTCWVCLGKIVCQDCKDKDKEKGK